MSVDDAGGSDSVLGDVHVAPYVKKDKRTIKCDICCQIFHQRRTPMSVEMCDMSVIGWSCDTRKQSALTSYVT